MLETRKKEHTYQKLDPSPNSTLRDIARYRHKTLAQLIEEEARTVIHRESGRIREDLADLNAANQMVRN